MRNDGRLLASLQGRKHALSRMQGSAQLCPPGPPGSASGVGMNDLRESQCIALVEYAPSVVGDRFDLIFISEANRITVRFTCEELAELIDSCVDAMATADGMAERSGLNRAEHEFRGHWGA